MFITFEGGEGSGKSTQSKLLAKRLVDDGYEVLLTREPGGTVGAESVRRLILTGSECRWGALTEALLYLACRADHWQTVIKPALEAGKIVISDRFQDSTIVYQGFCKGISIDLLNKIYQNITDNIYPDRTYLLNINPKIGVKRSINRCENKEIRYEKMKDSFHEKVWQSFLLMANNNSRFITINGDQKITTISDEVYADFVSFFKNHTLSNTSKCFHNL
jgi:dTMP kinase